MTGTRTIAARRVALPAGTTLTGATRLAPVEAPVALEYNGIGYAVMMATPIDLHDFAIGFTLAEGLCMRVDEIADVRIVAAGGGWIVRLSVPAAAMGPVAERARSRVSESGCGLCGIDSIAAALAPLPAAAAPPRVNAAGIATALAGLRALQPLGRTTGATHAAAFCAADGTIVMVREDVGRHTAFDKLIGALARAAIPIDGGFVLLSSRCSQELVDKAVRSGVTMLVTLSAATSLAVDRAVAAGLTLVVLARPDAMLVMNDPSGCLA